jgi:hypothetical protein
VMISQSVPVLVDREVSREKLLRELELWRANAMHRERGWILLDVDQDALAVELAFLAQISTSVGSGALPIVACAIRLTYENYDLWPPSLTFISAFTREPIRPHVRAYQGGPQAPRDVVIDSHPETNNPFLCLAGIREYHTHPQHTGDSWLLHRHLGEGSITTICDRIWRYMANTVIGVGVQMQALPLWPLRAQISIVLTQGELQQPDPNQPPSLVIYQPAQR